MFGTMDDRGCIMSRGNSNQNCNGENSIHKKIFDHTVKHVPKHTERNINNLYTTKGEEILETKNKNYGILNRI